MIHKTWNGANAVAKIHPRIKGVVKNLAILLIALAAIDIYRGSSLLERGSRAPTFMLDRLDNRSSGPVSLPTPSKPNLIYFSAPWCGVCKVTGDNLSHARGLLSAIGLNIEATEVSLSYADESSVRKYSKANGGKDLLLGNDRVSETYKISSFPTFYYVSADGDVRGGTTGYTTTLGLAIRGLLLLSFQ